MCGIVGVSLSTSDLPAWLDLLEAAIQVQHRGQDACGVICGSTNGQVGFHKGVGLVNEVFGNNHDIGGTLPGSFGVGHVRYATNGKHTKREIQPIISHDRGNVSIVHNGNLTNTVYLQSLLTSMRPDHRKVLGDTEMILELFLSKRPLCRVRSVEAVPRWIMSGLQEVYAHCIGSFACIIFDPDFGLVAFRDPNGIKPLVMAERSVGYGETDILFASETTAFRTTGYTFLKDIQPGEAVIIPSGLGLTGSARYTQRQVLRPQSFSPDLFEYVYFARAESILDGISVSRARQNAGAALAQSISAQMLDRGCQDDIDCVIPVPETSYLYAVAVAQAMRKPLAFGLVPNRFISRTFILPSQKERSRAVSRKLGIVQEEFHGKNVLIVDDSIVRGTTSRQIIRMARAAGARKIFFASGSPPIRHTHIHGIDLAEKSKLIAHQRTNDEIRDILECDEVFYMGLEQLVAACLKARSYGDISSFEMGLFTGNYTTGKGMC